MIRISVLMGIFNCAKTLPQALDCLINQTCADWKCIMCDDGSSDDTYSVAQTYVEKYPEKFILIKNETNQGLNITLNNCLALADTEYVARMDGDDVCDSTRFEKEIKFLDEHKKYSIVSSNMNLYDKDGIFAMAKYPQIPKNKHFLKYSPFCHAGCMVRTEHMKSVGGYAVDDKRLRVEDYDLWVRMYEKGYRGFNIQEPLYSMLDDRSAQRRRKFKFRVNEARVKAYAVKSLNLPFYSYIHCLKPIIIGLLPSSAYKILHRSTKKKANT